MTLYIRHDLVASHRDAKSKGALSVKLFEMLPVFNFYFYIFSIWLADLKKMSQFYQKILRTFKVQNAKLLMRKFKAFKQRMLPLN